MIFIRASLSRVLSVVYAPWAKTRLSAQYFFFLSFIAIESEIAVRYHITSRF